MHKVHRRQLCPGTHFNFQALMPKNSSEEETQSIAIGHFVSSSIALSTLLRSPNKFEKVGHLPLFKLRPRNTSLGGSLIDR